MQILDLRPKVRPTIRAGPRLQYTYLPYTYLPAWTIGCGTIP